MKVSIPTSIKDITLKQFQEYTKNPENVFEIFTNIKESDVSQKDYAEIVEQINLVLNEPAEFTHTFFIDDVEFGFVPNLDKITAGEYRDLTIYGTDIENLHKLMAVLFRPIKKKDSLGNYQIVNYNGTERFAKIMKYMPMNAVNGALVFFSSLANELINYTQKYMKVEQVKENKLVTTLKSGGGMRLFLVCVKVKFGKLIRC